MATCLQSIRINSTTLRSMLNDAKKICLNAIRRCLPDEGVKKALTDLSIDREVYLLAVGKAAFSMAKAASETVKVKKGIIISKYHHIPEKLENIDNYEAGHPLLDENSILATEKAIEMCFELKEDDIVVFLLSGGASALFESPLIPLEELRKLNAEMLKKGLSICEINAVRKKLSKVKGGRFADLCKPAKVYSIILSDVLSDRLDTIGSGPTVKDESDADEALAIIDRYGLEISDEVRKIIANNAPGQADNNTSVLIGSVRILCESAMEEAGKLGYMPILISDHIDCEAKEAGDLLMEKILEHRNDGKDIALIMGGETIVHVKGKGLGGRNQELVFSQLKKLAELGSVLIMSLGSDGTDGPTDAAGAYADCSSYGKLLEKGGNFEMTLEDNDSYHGLELIDSLIITGATGTNVNDITLALIKQKEE